MSARPLLFADFGKGPVSLGPIQPTEGTRSLQDWSPRQQNARYRARRWYLVECESAAAGRDFIRHNCQPCGCGGLCDSTVSCPMSYNDHRRLLDSGTNEVQP